MSNIIPPRQVHDAIGVDLVPDGPQSSSIRCSVQFLGAGVGERIIRVRHKGVAVDALLDGHLLQLRQRLSCPSVPPVVFSRVRPGEVKVQLRRLELA